MTQTIPIGDLFTVAELDLARHICRTTPDHQQAQALCDQLVGKVIGRINQITKQSNNAMYWAYTLVYMVNSNP